MALTWRNFCSEYWSELSGRQRIVGARAQVAAEVTDVRDQSRLGVQPDVATRVVVDVGERRVDGRHTVLDQLQLLVEFGMERGDIPDGVGVQLVLEVLLEPGQIVGGHPPVQFPIFGRRGDRIVEFHGFQRILPPEFRHLRDHAVGGGSLALAFGLDLGGQYVLHLRPDAVAVFGRRECLFGYQFREVGEVGLRLCAPVGGADSCGRRQSDARVVQSPLERSDSECRLLPALLAGVDVQSDLLQVTPDSLEFGGSSLQRSEFGLQSGDSPDHTPEVDLTEFLVGAEPGQPVPASRGIGLLGRQLLLPPVGRVQPILYPCHLVEQDLDLLLVVPAEHVVAPVPDGPAIVLLVSIFPPDETLPGHSGPGPTEFLHRVDTGIVGPFEQLSSSHL